MEGSPRTHKDEKQEKFSLYKMLELENTATTTTENIKKQYRKLVLKYHPDKNKEDPQAREKFQKLKEAHDILTDPEKRKVYDETGYVGGDEAAFQSAYDYFRAMYRKVTEQDIIKFEQKYRGSAEEEEDLLDFYNKSGGSMVKLLESIPLSRDCDVERFLEFYESKFTDKTLKKTKKYTETKSKVRPLPDEEEEWEDMQEEIRKEKQQDMSKLILAIRQNHNQRDFISSLEEKYCVGNKKKAREAEPNKSQKKRKQA